MSPGIQRGTSDTLKKERTATSEGFKKRRVWSFIPHKWSSGRLKSLPTISQQASRTSRQLFLHRWAYIHPPPDTCWEVPIAMDANLGESHRLEGLCKASEGTSQHHHSWALPPPQRPFLSHLLSSGLLAKRQPRYPTRAGWESCRIKANPDFGWNVLWVSITFSVASIPLWRQRPTSWASPSTYQPPSHRQVLTLTVSQAGCNVQPHPG